MMAFKEQNFNSDEVQFLNVLIIVHAIYVQSMKTLPTPE